MLKSRQRRPVIALAIALAFLCLPPGLAFASTATVTDLYGVSSSSTSPDFAVAVGQGGTILNTTDGGLIWLWKEPAQYRDLYDVGFDTTSGKGWAVGARGQIDYSTDGGQTWGGALSGTSQTLRSLAVVSGSVAYIAGGGPQVGSPALDVGIFLRTTNGGVDWESLSPNDPTLPPGATPLDQHRFTDVAASGNNVWLRGEHAGAQIVAFSTDRGTTWDSTPGGAALGDLELTGPGGATGYALSASPAPTATPSPATIMHTTDSWQTDATPKYTAADPLELLNDLDMVSDIAGWAVGKPGVIVHTTDSGANWATETSGTTFDLLGVSAWDSSNAWAVGRHGTILRTIDAGTTWSTIAAPVDTVRPKCYATARASCLRNHTATLKYRVDDPTSPLVKIKIRIKTKAGHTVKTLSSALPKSANLAATWRFKCTLRKGSYMYWVYATDLSGNVQSRIGKNGFTVK